MSTDTELPMEDRLATDPKLMQAHRDMRALTESMPDEVRRIGDQREIDEALDTWLGEDLFAWRREGQAVWDGNRSRLANS
jgi:hypothetical protein